MLPLYLHVNQTSDDDDILKICKDNILRYCRERERETERETEREREGMTTSHFRRESLSFSLVLNKR